MKSDSSDLARADLPEMPAYLNAPAIKALLSEHQIRPAKSMGQNFLADANNVRKICDLAGAGSGVRVLEIGPGLGSLTVGLLRAGAQVVAIEKDPRLVRVLEEVAQHATVIQADALACDLSSTVVAAAGGSWPAPWRLAANLPYAVATSIFVKVLQEVPEISGGVVMLQREVAERLTARPGQRPYGGVSAIVEYFAETKAAGKVPRSVFVPSPKVESALVTFERRSNPSVAADKDRLFELIKAGFSHRRKTFRNAISGLVWRDAALDACAAVGIDLSRRAETMSLAEFAAIVEFAADAGGSQVPADG